MKEFPKVPFFHVTDTARLIGVHRTTVWRWATCGKIAYEEDPAGEIIVRIDEINRMRELFDLDPLTQEHVDYYWTYGKLPHGVGTKE